MKRLVLVRHAKSSWKNPGQADFDRPLNQRGKRDAPVMAGRLAAQGIAPNRIVSSPARRARKTAKAIAAALDYPADEIELEEELYEAGVATLLHLVRCLDDADREVLLVGHNPGFTDLCNLLTGAAIANLPTCATATVEFDLASWALVGPASGQLTRFDTPKDPAA
ncbi:MAG: histidine phosphatase family protein [Deferrisomatales bacterium]|nr:histidine phosphatase family protein [Deferrisomatales bacterium]